VTNQSGKEISTEQARMFLATHFDPAIADVEQIGEGAWSRCFGFRRGSEELAARFGRYVEDFRQDQLAMRYAAPDLPIPQVLAIGRAFDGYYAISTRAYGEPLEQLPPAAWAATVPSLVAALEAIRTADISRTTGFGGWDGDGGTTHASWAAFLLDVDADTPDMRSYGWQAKLAGSPAGAAAFAWGFDRLKQVAPVPAPRCLIHSDLSNRNVLVKDAKITGVFDWGCGLYGDHLYDLAWFEFWAPWHPNLDVPLLRAALEAHWNAIGLALENKAERLQACYLHIGLSHLAYNAHVGDFPTLIETADRMRSLIQHAT
jgi:hygromycin-B 4-O-kinase